MALIHCPECNREVSDKASSCPHCGNPMNPASALSLASPLQEKQITPAEKPLPVLYGNDYCQEQLDTVNSKVRKSKIRYRVTAFSFFVVGLLLTIPHEPSSNILAYILLFLSPFILIMSLGASYKKTIIYKAGQMSDGSICCPRCGDIDFQAVSKVGTSIIYEGAPITGTNINWVCKKCGTEFCQ